MYVYRLSCSNMSLMPFFLFGTENFRENISFVKTQTRLKILCIFLGFVGVAKGKVGRKVYGSSGPKWRSRCWGGDVREEVRENKRDQSGGNQTKNMTSVVKRLEPTVAAENGTIKTSAGFMLVDQSDNEEPTVEVVEEVLEKGKKRTQSERLQEPIKVKKAGRCKKVNVTSWRNQVLTMKKKASRMQIEAGAQPNFLIIMFNNVQDPHASNPSASDGKYLTYMARARSRRS